MTKPKIYCWINGYAPQWYVSMAMAEDGTHLGSHVSSSPEWAKFDIGFATEDHRRREDFAKHYPDGYELEWIERDDVMTHEGLTAAYEKAERSAAQ